MAAKPNEALRELPSVEVLAAALDGPHEATVAAARAAIAAERTRILERQTPADGGDEAGDDCEDDDGNEVGDAAGLVGEQAAPSLLGRAKRLLAERRRGSLRRVINATGVILHTNLGRAPLAPEAAAAAAEIAAGYSNLEYDLERGERGRRHAHVEAPLRELSGAEAAIAVNNNAAAVLLALAATAAGREVVVGRDQLIEIGGSFRIPEILEQSGATLVEVGTTNRTRAADYAAAIAPSTGALLRVHQSNFRIEGFTEGPALAELCELGRARGVPVIDDLGSGALGPAWDEPLLRDSVAAGAELVCCSADKLLGGPQAGIIVGSESTIARCRSHPLARALRLDKLQIAALAATLRLHRDGEREAIPALAMLAAPAEELRLRAELICELVGPSAVIVDSASRPGGGTLPTTELAGPACAVDPGPRGADAVLAGMRGSDPPVIARIEGGRVMLDPRTMDDAEARIAARAVVAALD